VQQFSIYRIDSFRGALHKSGILKYVCEFVVKTFTFAITVTVTVSLLKQTSSFTAE